MENRPQSRKKYNSGKTTEVHSGGKVNSGTSSIIKGGSGISVIGIILFVLYTLFTGGNGTGNQTGNTNTSLNNVSSLMQSASNYTEVNDTKLNYEVDSKARDKFTTLIGNGEDEVTIMIYMIGSDLESNHGMATRDLNEMLHAEIGDNVNIVIQTGGARNWQNNVVSNKVNQIYEIDGKGLKVVEKDFGTASMTEGDTLSTFIKYAEKNYEANRYFLILWDHGGGSVSGYGYDEKYPRMTMGIDELSNSLKNSGVKFDLIGFDACLMANLETAIAVKPYADYLIASEEIEPGTGWYYTNWLTTLSKNTSISTLDLSKNLIDDYMSNSQNSAGLTLSLTDLAELDGTLNVSLKDFSVNLSSLIKSDDFKVVSDARSSAKEFSKSSKLDQVDLYDFAMKVNTEESKALASVIKSAVKYNRSSNISSANGLSIYFPYSSLSKMNSMVHIYENIDIDDEYSDAVKNFATLTSSGQIVNNNSGSSATSLIDTLLGNTSSGSSSNVDIFSLLSGSDFSGLLGGSGMDSSSLMNIAQIIGRNKVDPNNFEVTEVNGQKVLSLSEEEWALIKEIELNVFVDDGNGFIDLGLDNVFDFNADGDLIVEYDNSWLALNDNIVAYKMISHEVSDNYYKIQGYIPAYLNNEFVNIMVEFNSDNEQGFVLGARPVYEETEQESKGLIEIVDGDVIQFVCDYISYDGSTSEKHFLNEAYVVSGPLELTNINIENDGLIYSYRLTDIYNSNFWLPAYKN